MQITKVIKEHGLTISEVAERMGVNKSTLSTTISHGNMLVDTLRRIAQAVGCSISEFFADEEAHREVLLPKGRRNNQRSIRHIEGFFAPCYQHKRQKTEFNLSNILGHRERSMAMLQESKSCKNRDALRAIFKSQMH